MIVAENLVELYKKNGAVIIPRVLSTESVVKLREELEYARNQDLLERSEVFDKGMVHNCMFRGAEMARVLDNEVMNKYLAQVLSACCIIYAYQSSSAPPQEGNYGSRVHVDSPRFIAGYPTNVGVILPLDDFTKENGATLYLRGSHLIEDLPSEEEFQKNCSVAECKAGDMILFNARLAHATGINTTNKTRHALTINFCRSFMRQRFDFCRMDAADDSFLSSLKENGRKLLGMNVRMPTSLDEFYLPESERLYKPGQE